MTRAVLPAAALALAVAGPASAATGVRTAELTVQLEGVQKTTWEKHHFAEGGCD